MEPEALKLTKTLRKVSSDELMYIILAYDYYSKYHQFPLKDRRVQAEREVFGPKTEDYEKKNPKILEAIDEYKSLQYDHRRELINTYIEKVETLRVELINAGSIEVKKYLDSIKALNEAIDKTQKELDRDEEAEKLKGGGSLSFIEKWQKNQAEYKKKQKIEAQLQKKLEDENV